MARKLALLVRPTLIAQSGNTFVWSDWSTIEARVLPWLTDNEGGVPYSPSSNRTTRIQRCPISTCTPPPVSSASIRWRSPRRSVRKANSNACPWLSGGRRALQAMAANYRMFLERRRSGRDRRPMARRQSLGCRVLGWHDDFASYGLWGAAMTAWENPGQITEAGRVAFASTRIISTAHCSWRCPPAGSFRIQE